MFLEQKIQSATKILRDHNISSSRLDAEIIISDILGIERENLIISDQIYINDKTINKYDSAIYRRLKREPIAYITGKKEFWSHNFLVNRSTLVPRPETEILIHKIVKIFKDKKINILDIGTGSGCIILSILNSLKFSRGVGIDISSKAIEIAKANSKRMKLSNRVKFKVLDLAKIYGNQFDLVVSNPPYIPLKDIKNLSKDIRNYEPIIALNGGVDGLDLVKKVIYKSIIVLKKNGLLAIEIGNGQYRKVSNLLKQSGFRELSKEYDYKDNVRCIISTKL
tara:strand:+ start:287 stop:1126 length:840 start_codon:yes stop_codon:yes gene_type:complete